MIKLRLGYFTSKEKNKAKIVYHFMGDSIFKGAINHKESFNVEGLSMKRGSLLGGSFIDYI